MFCVFDITSNTLLHSTYFGGNKTDIATDIDVIPSGNNDEVIYITGATQSPNFPQPIGGNPSLAFSANYQGTLSDYFICAMASTKQDFLWSTYIGGDVNEVYSPAISINANQDLYLSGWSTSGLNFPLQTPGNPTYYQGYRNGATDMTVTKMKTNIINVLGINENTLNSKNLSIQIYPNPSNMEININSKEFLNEKVNYEIIDVLGKTVKKGILENQNTSIKIDNLSNGSYLVRVSTSSIISTGKFIKVQ